MKWNKWLVVVLGLALGSILGGGIGLLALSRLKDKDSADVVNEVQARPSREKPTAQPLGANTTPPTSPVEVATEVGSVATRFSKATVRVEATVTPKGVTYRTHLQEFSGFSSAQLDLDNAAVSDLVGALTATKEAPAVDYSKSFGKLTVTNKDEMGTRIVTIRYTVERSFSPDSLSFDTVNAQALCNLLRRAQSTQKWLEPRVQELAR